MPLDLAYLLLRRDFSESTSRNLIYFVLLYYGVFEISSFEVTIADSFYYNVIYAQNSS